MDIDEYVTNILSGQNLIGELYRRLRIAEYYCANNVCGWQMCYKFTYPVLGGICKKYNYCDLLTLNHQGICTSIEELYLDLLLAYSDQDEDTLLDTIVKLLYKKRNDILNLYDAVKKAEQYIHDNRRMCYLFVNPYQGFPCINLDTNKKNYNEDSLYSLKQASREIPFVDIFNLDSCA